MRDTVNITEITYDFEESWREDGKYDVYIYFSGEKTYDADGNGQGRKATVSYRFIDKDGFVIKDGTFYSPSLRNGDKFRKEKETIYDIPEGEYTVELSSTN